MVSPGHVHALARGSTLLRALLLFSHILWLSSFPVLLIKTLVVTWGPSRALTISTKSLLPCQYCIHKFWALDRGILGVGHYSGPTVPFPGACRALFTSASLEKAFEFDPFMLSVLCLPCTSLLMSVQHLLCGWCCANPFFYSLHPFYFLPTRCNYNPFS